jgi:PAS domain S-box-containing protein
MAAKSKSRPTSLPRASAQAALNTTWNAPMAMATLDGASRIVQEVNPAFCRLLKHTRAKIVGRPLDEFPPFGDSCVRELDQVFRSKRPATHTEKHRVGSQPVFWSCTMWSITADPRLVGVLIQVVEATKADKRTLEMNEALILGSLHQHKLTAAAETLNRRLKTEMAKRLVAGKKLRTSETRYRRLFEATNDGVLLLDPETCEITDANPFMTTLLDYSHAQLVGKQLFEIGLLKDERASRAMFRKLKRDKQVRYEDLPLASRRGRRQEVEVVATLYEEGGHSVIQCNIRDITERKRAQAILLRSQTLFSALIAQAPVGVYVVNSSFELLQVNPKAKPLFKKFAPLLGRSFSEIIHVLWPAEIADAVVERFRHTLRTGESYQSPEFDERRQDTGAQEVYEWQIQRVTLPAGEYGVVCFFNNITARKRAEGALRRLEALTATNSKLTRQILQREAAEQALRESERHALQLLAEARLLQERLRHLTHQIVTVQEEQRKRISRELHDDITQLLVGIGVHLANFAKAAVLNPENIRKTITPLRRLVEKSVRIVHRFARELRPAMLDDLGLVPALKAYIDDLPRRKGRRIEFEGAGEFAELDNDRRTVLYRVAQEALINVGKHAKARVVKVSLSEVAAGACLEVRDDGKAFDVASLMSAKWNRRLGLVGMRERVEMVGGEFDVISISGKGTTVRAVVPLGR